jgi:heptosyltransferase I
MKILIVKLSSLGDVVHAMPAVQDIRRALPGAVIDWVVEPGFAPLVRRCKGVRRVIVCNQRQWRKAPFAAATRQAFAAFKAELQAEAYDAVIDLQGLTKSALVARLAYLSPQGQRYALANRTDGSGYEAPTRWLADVAVQVTQHSHAVARSRELCAKALGYGQSDLAFDNEYYGLYAPGEYVKLAIKTGVSGGEVALVHGTSRADKLWPEAHWVALGQRLAQAGFGLALPHGNGEELARSQRIAQALHDLGPGVEARVQVWPRLPLDALTDAFAHTAGVIGVDSGLSHIAVALDLPHVQLYNVDTAWRTGPNGARHGQRQRSVFAAPQPSVDQVWQAWLAVSATPVSPA